MEIIGTAPTVEFDYGAMWTWVLVLACLAYVVHFIVLLVIDQVKGWKVILPNYLYPLISLGIAAFLTLIVVGGIMTGSRNGVNKDLLEGSISECGFTNIDFNTAEDYWTAIRDNTIVNGQVREMGGERIVSSQWGCAK